MIVLANDKVTDVAQRGDHPDELWVRVDELEDATGFVLKPEGACFGELCVPIAGDDAESMLQKDGDTEWFNMSRLAEKLGQEVVHDANEDIWSLSAIPTVRASTLESAVAPDFEIEDIHGEVIRLSDFRGKKVLITTWASW